VVSGRDATRGQQALASLIGSDEGVSQLEGDLHRANTDDADGLDVQLHAWRWASHLDAHIALGVQGRARGGALPGSAAEDRKHELRLNAELAQKNLGETPPGFSAARAVPWMRCDKSLQVLHKRRRGPRDAAPFVLQLCGAVSPWRGTCCRGCGPAGRTRLRAGHNTPPSAR